MEGKLFFPIFDLWLFNYFVFQLHVQGKTDEAKADLSRLAKIRAEREAAQAKRKAEAEGKHYTLIPSAITLRFRTWLDYIWLAKAAEAEAKKKAQLAKRGTWLG